MILKNHFETAPFFFSLTKQGQDAIIKTERAPLLAVSPSLSCNEYYADRLGATKRSASFYGKRQGQNDHKHEKFQKKLSHSSLTPFQKDFAWGEELTAIVRNNASFRPFWQGILILANFIELCNTDKENTWQAANFSFISRRNNLFLF